MEPRTHARGNNLKTGRRIEIEMGFNGATHSRAWKHI